MSNNSILESLRVSFTHHPWFSGLSSPSTEETTEENGETSDSIPLLQRLNNVTDPNTVTTASNDDNDNAINITLPQIDTNLSLESSTLRTVYAAPFVLLILIKCIYDMLLVAILTGLILVVYIHSSSKFESLLSNMRSNMDTDTDSNNNSRENRETYKEMKSLLYHWGLTGITIVNWLFWAPKLTDGAEITRALTLCFDTNKYDTSTSLLGLIWLLIQTDLVATIIIFYLQLTHTLVVCIQSAWCDATGSGTSQDERNEQDDVQDIENGSYRGGAATRIRRMMGTNSHSSRIVSEERDGDVLHANTVNAKKKYEKVSQGNELLAALGLVWKRFIPIAYWLVYYNSTKMAAFSLVITYVIIKSYDLWKLQTNIAKLIRSHHHKLNVGVRPTHEEVTAVDQMCSICLCDLRDPIKLEECHHIFCKVCIHEWIESSKKHSCPTCRQNIAIDDHFRDRQAFLQEVNWYMAIF